MVEASPGTQRFQNRMDTNQNCHLDFMVARRRAGIGDASGMMRVAQLEVKTHELICQVRRADRVVAISTSCGALYDARGLDVPSLARACEAKGSRFVVDFDGAERCKREMVFEAPAEILCPCVRHNTITAANAGGVQARIVSSGSNHPYDLETERRLTARGTVLLPYWISNCGGTLGETMEFAGWRGDEIAAFLHRKLEPNVRWLIGEARKTGLTQTEIAKPPTFTRFQRLSEQAERRGLGARIAGAGLECYRRGLVPSGAVRLLSRSYFEQSVLLPLEQETVM